MTGFYVGTVVIAVAMIGFTLWLTPRLGRMIYVRPVQGRSEDETRRWISRTTSTIVIVEVVAIFGGFILLAALR